MDVEVFAEVDVALVVVAKEKTDSASGSRMRAVSAKAMNTKPPIMVT